MRQDAEWFSWKNRQQNCANHMCSILLCFNAIMWSDLARWTKATIQNESLLIWFLRTLKWIIVQIYSLEMAVNWSQHMIFVIEGHTIRMDRKQKKPRQEIQIHWNIEIPKLGQFDKFTCDNFTSNISCYRIYLGDGIIWFTIVHQKCHSKVSRNEEVRKYVDKKWN